MSGNPGKILTARLGAALNDVRRVAARIDDSKPSSGSAQAAARTSVYRQGVTAWLHAAGSGERRAAEAARVEVARRAAVQALIDAHREGLGH